MRRIRWSKSVLVALIGLTVALPLPVVAQQATPGMGIDQFPIVPDPTACTVAPRAVEEMLALWYGPDGSPIPVEAGPVGQTVPSEVIVPVGAPADAATTAAVTAAVRDIFSCFAAGDVLRAFALFTDDLARQFGPEPGTPREEAEVFLTHGFPEEATPTGATPATETGDEAAGASQIVAITNVTVLPDGRVAAFVVEFSDGQLFTVYALFERAGDQLLADEVIEFASAEGGADAGTPAP